MGTTVPPTPPSQPDAARLVEEIRAELEPIEQRLAGHRFVTALTNGDVPADALRQFAAEQHWIISGDRRSFAHLAARFSNGPGGELFLSLAQGEGVALGHLDGFARWLDLDPALLDDTAPTPGAHAYTAYVSWLALNGSAADVAAAFLANLRAWGINCGRSAQALRERYGADDAAVAFFDFFATPAPGFEDDALAVIDHGLRRGSPPGRALSAARLLQAYELMFWDSMADAADEAA
ncbi:transcriptional regulator [Phytoactinopolyspora limicola]|uniref:transcriptional regulator n=1 Tax=Phytoactinopolyspora limicola TaxID=2715536 RepID=UPI0014095AE2|nr:transcriptional regulator [Phytoactinopolyspora limicola]